VIAAVVVVAIFVIVIVLIIVVRKKRKSERLSGTIATIDMDSTYTSNESNDIPAKEYDRPDSRSYGEYQPTPPELKN